MIKSGIAASDAKRVVGDFDLDQQVMCDALALKTVTVNRKAARHETLSPDDSEHMLGVARLIGQVEAMLEGADQTRDFDVPGRLSRWLRDPLPDSAASGLWISPTRSKASRWSRACSSAPRVGPMRERFALADRGRHT